MKVVQGRAPPYFLQPGAHCQGGQQHGHKRSRPLEASASLFPRRGTLLLLSYFRSLFITPQVRSMRLERRLGGRGEPGAAAGGTGVAKDGASARGARPSWPDGLRPAGATLDKYNDGAAAQGRLPVSARGVDHQRCACGP